MVRAPCCEKTGLKKGPWAPDEDQILVDYIRVNGHNNWRALPKHAGLLRCGKSCRLRWTNYLRPDIKRGNFSQEEEESIIKLHGLLGNRWSAIAAKLPGRTDNEIKNVWHTHLKKRLPPQENNQTNAGSTATTPVSSPATAINVAPGPTRKRSRKPSMSKLNGTPKKRASTHEKSMEPSGNNDVIAMPTNSIKSEPVSPQPCTSDVSTLTSTSTNNENNASGSENDSSRGTSTNRETYVVKAEIDPCQGENVGVNLDTIGDLPEINDEFWMDVLSVEDTAISTEDLPSEGAILGTDPVFETKYSNVNYEDMDVFWHNLLTESHELLEMTDIL